MFPYQRLYDLFDYVNNNSVVLPRNVAKYLHVSVRTIRSDIAIINTILDTYHMEIYLKRNKGYSLKIENQKQFEIFIKEYNETNVKIVHLETTDERIRYILCHMIMQTDYISLEEIADMIFVGIGTLQNYLRSIKKELKKYKLELMSHSQLGIKIVGEEQSKRECFIHNINTTQSVASVFSKSEYNYFKELKLDLLKASISHIFKEDKISISDVNLKKLVIYIAVMLLRTQDNHHISVYLTPMKEKEHEVLLDKIIDYLHGEYGVDIVFNEREYLYSYMISTIDYKSQTIDNKIIDNMIKEFLEFINDNYSFDFREDFVLIESLKKHLASLLNSKKIELNNENPFLETIKSNFPLPYEISFLFFNKYLSEDDMAYISLYIASAIERNLNTKKTRNIILVCDAGQAIVNILKTRIESYFSNLIHIIGVYSCAEANELSAVFFENIDFVISTISLKNDYCPTIRVDFTLNDEDIESISKMINNSYKKKVDFFDQNLFILQKKYQDKTDLLNDMANCLMRKDLVDQNYINNVIEREKLGGTNIGELFALPHAVNTYSHTTKVVVAILDKPIIWDRGKMAQLVFLLATDEDKYNIDEVYNIAIEIANNSNLQKKLLKVSNYEEFIKLLF